LELKIIVKFQTKTTNNNCYEVNSDRYASNSEHYNLAMKKQPHKQNI